MCAGAASSRTSTDSRTSRQAPRTISTVVTSDADRIGGQPAGVANEQRRDHRPDGRKHVAKHVEVGAAHVEAAPRPAVEQPRRDRD